MQDNMITGRKQLWSKINTNFLSLCPLENQSSAKDLQHLNYTLSSVHINVRTRPTPIIQKAKRLIPTKSLVQISNEYRLAYIDTVYLKRLLEF